MWQHTAWQGLLGPEEGPASSFCTVFHQAGLDSAGSQWRLTLNNQEPSNSPAEALLGLHQITWGPQQMLPLWLAGGGGGACLGKLALAGLPQLQASSARHRPEVGTLTTASRAMLGGPGCVLSPQ